MSQREQGLFRILRPRQGKKSSNTNPYSTCGKPGGRWTRAHLGNWATWCPKSAGQPSGGCPKQPPASGLGTCCRSSKRAARWTETGSPKARHWTESRTEKWLHPRLPTDLLLPLRSERKLLPRALPNTGSRCSGEQHAIQKWHQFVCRATEHSEVGASYMQVQSRYQEVWADKS